MKEILGSSHNLYFVPDDKGTLIPHVEIVLLLSEPTYALTNTGDVRKDRFVEAVRYAVPLSGLPNIAKSFMETFEAAAREADAVLAAARATGAEEVGHG